MVIAQLAGVLYLGFAALNWMARGNIIGGIYSRPVTIGNVLHFVSGTAVILKALSRERPRPATFWILAVIYVRIRRRLCRLALAKSCATQ